LPGGGLSIIIWYLLVGRGLLQLEGPQES